MIYTVTFNPSIDYILQSNILEPGKTMRTESEIFRVGGKGINVSLMLKNLGIKSVATGFVAGFTGDEIEKQLERLEVDNNFIKLENGTSRINVKILNVEGTEINGRGSAITEADIKKLENVLDEAASGDTMVLSGSARPDDIYARLTENFNGKQIRVAVDCAGAQLKNVVPKKPFMVKPNVDELGDFFGAEIKTVEDAKKYATEMRTAGAQNVLVSLGKDGAVLAAENGKTYEAKAPEGPAVNTVGAGDSMLAGFLYKFENNNFEDALKFSIACGSATAFSDGFAPMDYITDLYSHIL